MLLVEVCRLLPSVRSFLALFCNVPGSDNTDLALMINFVHHLRLHGRDSRVKEIFFRSILF